MPIHPVDEQPTKDDIKRIWDEAPVSQEMPCSHSRLVVGA